MVTVAIFPMYLQLDEDDPSETSHQKLDLAQLNTLSETLRQKLGLDLFGVDVIIECDTQRYAVIDINVFPSKFKEKVAICHKTGLKFNIH